MNAAEPSQEAHSSLRTFVYEGTVAGDAVGGARVHFQGMSSALASRLGGDLTVVVPGFRGDRIHVPGEHNGNGLLKSHQGKDVL